MPISGSTAHLSGQQGAGNTGPTLQVSGSTTLGDAAGDSHIVTGSTYVADNSKIYFGEHKDVYIEYDEDGTDELRFAGAAVTFEQAVTFDGGMTLGEAVTDVTTIAGQLTASQGVRIPDDRQLSFGSATNGDATFEYDEDGTDRLVYSGAGLRISDDTKLEFGTDGDFTIEYDEDGTNTAQFAGAPSVFAAGVTFGSTIACNGTVTLGDAATDVTTATARLTGSQGLLIPDNQKLYFGTAVTLGADASLEYDEDLSDRLIISGSGGQDHSGTEITGSVYLRDDAGSNGAGRSSLEIVQQTTSATNTTALKVQSDGGITAVHVDKNFTSGTAAVVTGLSIDLDKTAATTSNNTIYGVNVDLDNTTATDGTNTMIGVQVTPTLTHAAAAGSPTVKGAVITATGAANGTSIATGMELTVAGAADTNTGLLVNCTDGGTDLKVVSSADTGDYFSIATTTHGATTIATVDDDSNDDADLTLDADGKIVVEAKAGDEAVFNEGGLDVDFRVESVDETHMIFVEGSSNRASIGDSTDAPAATLELTNASDGGVPLLQLNSNDTDKIGVDINAANIDADVIDITADAVTTANVIDITADALTTGTALNIATTATNDSAGSLVKIAQAASRAGSAASIGLHIDFDTVANANARALKIDSEQTTGVVAEFDGNAITTGTGVSIATNARTTGTALTISDTATNDSAGSLVKIHQDGDRSGTAASVALLIDVDTDENPNARALKIDSDQTTGVVAEINGDAVTTGTVLDVAADGLTTGNALLVADDSSSTSTRKTVAIEQENVAAIAATALSVQSDGGITGISLEKGFTGTANATVTGLNIDLDKTAATTSDNTIYGVNVDLDNTSATNGTNVMVGIQVTPTLTHDADAGTTTVKGAVITATGGTNGTAIATGMELTSTGADVNNGLIINCANGDNNIDLRIVSSADTGDYFQIQVDPLGETIFETVDDGGAKAHMHFEPDGEMFISASMWLQDDKRIYFGTGPAGHNSGPTGPCEASIYYEETASNQLIISGALTGTVLSMPINCDTGFDIVSRVPDANGSDMMTSFMKFDTTTDEEAILVGKNLILRSGDLKVENDYHMGGGSAFEDVLGNGDHGSAEVLYYGPSADTTLVKGGLYYLATSGVWTAANASAASGAHKVLLAIALGTSARSHGMLTKGFVRIPATEVLHVPGSGATDGLAVFVSSSDVSGGAAGHCDFTAPSASGDVERVVGYCIDDDSSSILLYFDSSHPGEVLD